MLSKKCSLISLLYIIVNALAIHINAQALQDVNIASYENEDIPLQRTQYELLYAKPKETHLDGITWQELYLQAEVCNHIKAHENRTCDVIDIHHLWGVLNGYYLAYEYPGYWTGKYIIYPDMSIKIYSYEQLRGIYSVNYKPVLTESEMRMLAECIAKDDLGWDAKVISSIDDVPSSKTAFFSDDIQRMLNKPFCFQRLDTKRNLIFYAYEPRNRGLYRYKLILDQGGCIYPFFYYEDAKLFLGFAGD
jgi:hypothetical protein